MIDEVKMFGNWLIDDKIIPARKYNFTEDLIGRLTAANGSGDYTTLIALLTPRNNVFGVNIGLVDSASVVRSGKTLTNDQVMAAFKLTMGTKKGAIADLVGGFTTAAYLECYPEGATEYSVANKTQIPTLVNRVFVFATAHSGALGATMTGLLHSFQALWTSSRDEQVLQKGVVVANRTLRNDSDLPLEEAILTTIHTIGGLFPGDVASCIAFFGFDLLFPVPHHLHDLHSGTAAPGLSSMVINRLLTDNVKLIIKNTSLNADMLAYLGATATSAPLPGQGVIIKANHGKHPHPHELGDLSNPFLIIKDLSGVNPVNFIVELIG